MAGRATTKSRSASRPNQRVLKNNPGVELREHGDLFPLLQYLLIDDLFINDLDIDHRFIDDLYIDKLLLSSVSLPS